MTKKEKNQASISFEFTIETIFKIALNEQLKNKLYALLYEYWYQIALQYSIQQILKDYGF